MNLDDLLLGEFTELKPAEMADEPSPSASRSAAGEIFQGLKRGVTVGVPRMVGQGMKWASEPGAPIYEAGDAMTVNADVRGANPDEQLEPEAHSTVTNALASGAEMLPASVAPQVVATVGDVLFPPGAPYFHAGAAALTGAAFGASQAQDTYERVLDETGDEDAARKAGWISGGIEAGGEFGSSLVGGAYLKGALRFLGPKKGASVVARVLEKAKNPQALKNFGIATLTNAATETGTEMAQNAGEAAVERHYGATNGPTPLEAAKEAIAPTLGMSALMIPLGGVGAYRQNRQAKTILDLLEDSQAPIDQRAQAAAFFQQEMAKTDQDAADQWAAKTLEAISQGQAINVVEPKTESTGGETEGPEISAVPAQIDEEPGVSMVPEIPVPQKPAGPLQKAVEKTTVAPLSEAVAADGQNLIEEDSDLSRFDETGLGGLDEQPAPVSQETTLETFAGQEEPSIPLKFEGEKVAPATAGVIADSSMAEVTGVAEDVEGADKMELNAINRGFDREKVRPQGSLSSNLNIPQWLNADKKVPVFSSKEESLTSTPLSDVEFDTVFKRITSGAVNRDGFVVADSTAELPFPIRAEIEKQGTDPNAIDGVFHRGKVYIIKKNIASPEQLEEAAFHEWYGHAGLRGIAGNDGQVLQDKMNELYGMMKPGEMLRISKKYGFNLAHYARDMKRVGYADEIRHATLMEELLAHMTKEYSGDKLAAKVREIIGALRDWLRQQGFAKLAERNEYDLALLLKNARAYAESGAWMEDGPIVTFNRSLLHQEQAEEEAADKARSTEASRVDDAEFDDLAPKFLLRDKIAAVRRFTSEMKPDSEGVVFRLFEDFLPDRVKASVRSVLSNPHWESKGSVWKKSLYDLAVARSEKANEIKHEIMASKEGYAGFEEFRKLWNKASRIDKREIAELLVEGDRRGKEWTEGELFSMGRIEIVQKAYLAAREAINHSAEVMFDMLGRFRLIPFEGSEYYDELIDLLDQNLSGSEVEKRLGLNVDAVHAYRKLQAGRETVKKALGRFRNDNDFEVIVSWVVDGLSKHEYLAGLRTGSRKAEAAAIRRFDEVMQAVKEADVEFVTAAKYRGKSYFKILRELLAHGDDHPMLAKAELYFAYLGVLDFDSKLAKLKSEWKTREGYLPRIRQDGEWHVRVLEVDESGEYKPVYMQARKTRHTADVFAKQIRRNVKKYVTKGFRDDVTYQVEVKRNEATPEEIFMGLGSHRAIEALLTRVFDKAENAGLIEDATSVQAKVLEILADEIAARGFERHRIARADYLIEGYETEEMASVIGQHIGAMAGWLSKSEFAIRAGRVMTEIPNSRPQDKVWAREYVDDALKNSTYLDQWVGTARAFISLMYLGLKGSSVFINATQNYVWGQAKLSSYTKGATRKLLTAQKDILLAHLTKEKGQLSEDEQWALEEGLRRGITNANLVRALSGGDETGGMMGKSQSGLRWLTEKAMIPFQKVETHFNREPALLAAFRVFHKEQGLEKEEALKKAIEFVNDVHFNMNKENLPAAIRKIGPMGRMLYVFQGFTHNYLLGMLYSLGKGELGIVLRSLTALVFFGGLAALPFGDDMDKWYRRAFGERPLRMFEKWLRTTSNQYVDFGDQLTDFVLHGAPALAGVNISNSIAVHMPWFSPEDETLAERMGGVWSGLAQKVYYAGKSLAKGNEYRAMEQLTPEFVANILRAFRLYADGNTTMSGIPIFGTDGKQQHYTSKEAVIRAFGFMPLEPSKETQKRWDARQGKEYWQERKADVLAKIRTVKTRREVLKLVREFNQAVRKSPTGILVGLIDMGTIRRALRAKPNRRELAYNRS